MANKRMFSNEIVGSDFFLDLPASTQALYFQLGMHADDRGFVQPKKVMRILGSNDNELHLLKIKKFVLSFEDGVILIKHWRMNNNKIDADRFRETTYIEHLQQINIKDNMAYTQDKLQGIPVCAQIVHISGTQSRVEQSRTIPAKAVSFTIEEENPKLPRTPKDPLVPKYNELLKWAEIRRGFIFVSRVKQYAAFKKARENGIELHKLKDRWKELEGDTWREGFDWTSVVSSFDKKG